MRPAPTRRMDRVPIAGLFRVGRRQKKSCAMRQINLALPVVPCNTLPVMKTLDQILNIDWNDEITNNVNGTKVVGEELRKLFVDPLYNEQSVIIFNLFDEAGNLVGSLEDDGDGLEWCPGLDGNDSELWSDLQLVSEEE